MKVMKPEMMATRLGENLQRVDVDLDIMENHGSEIFAVEQSIRESMKKWDREYKDAHFHAVPKGLKHQR